MITTGGISSITQGSAVLQSAKISEEKGKFESLVKELSEGGKAGHNLSSSQIAEDGRLNGDYGTGFAHTYTSESAKHALPSGAAANQSMPGETRTIDKTSKLYEKSLEMESYMVKMMLSSMRKTVMKSDTDESYAKTMYEDMLYDEYATTMTKNAGFGIADQLYLQLSQGGILS